MSEKTPIAENIDTLSVKDAFAADVEVLKFRSTVIIDPAPMPFIPITPIVYGDGRLVNKFLNIINK